ncbi:MULTISPECIES: TRAP transporter large permease [unclassified Arenibacter]|jgi:tripartite ATP-independent transporter DctM subunit|uniref:TRAP transporter large permease n=1 Tax=unclassified Arenibacter TaxID=2615047 RepID=UPI000E343EB4|nr:MULTISPECIES: TRAP transporter large permease [unclassified Arenibacter]MCM4162182.1 C4-dicarboxylate ABC transporter permease [Arenibacter sp. A80]RFT57794.1 TRAP transporter large permease [Arenibacter sp. P308M17]
MIWILVIVFILGLILRFPIAFALGLACLSYLVVKGVPLILVPMKMYSGIDVFVLLSVPGFILAGNLMNQGGLTEKIIKFCNHLLGHIRGGLSLVNIGASMLFAGISGTAISDTASMGSIMIPAMKKEGYDTDFSCAVTAASSTIGPIIPPSVPMIIAATLSGLSVGKLFLAGALPGLLLGIGLMLTAYFISRRKKYPKHKRSSLRDVAGSFVDTFWSLLMTFIILYGIVGGIFTPTEASIIAVVYAMVIGKFVYKKLNMKNTQVIILDSMKTSASLMVLVGFANLFGYILITEQIPQEISMEILGFSDNKYVVLLLINLLLIVVGTFMETIAALLILFPILLKVAVAVDVDPIHFAVIAVLNLIIGLTTPPVGVCLFVASSIGKISIGAVSKAGLPFLLVSFLVLILVTLFPWLSLALPNLFID